MVCDLYRKIILSKFLYIRYSNHGYSFISSGPQNQSHSIIKVYFNKILLNKFPQYRIKKDPRRHLQHGMPIIRDLTEIQSNNAVFHSEYLFF